MQALDHVGMREGYVRDVPEPRLVKAAHEFEAQLMKELLKPMTEGNDLSGEGDARGSGGVLGEFAAETLGRALSEQGGLGIASGIVRSLSHSGNQFRFKPAAADLTKRTTNT